MLQMDPTALSTQSDASSEPRFFWRDLSPFHDESGEPRAFRDYHIYGISLRSEIALTFPEHRAGLPADQSAPSPQLWSVGDPARGKWGRLPRVTFFLAPEAWFEEATAGLIKSGRSGEWHEYVHCPDGSDFLRWADLFEFLVSPDGQWVACRRLEKATLESFQTYLLGQVLSMSLVKLGYEPLHATTVVVEGKAVAFLGQSGYGKSTLGAVFLHAGYKILTDDLLLIRDVDGMLCGFPGPPRIKLFPEIAQQFLPGQIPLVPMNPITEKLIIPLTPHQWRKTPAPMYGFFLLDEPGQGEAGLSLTSLSAAQAFLALVRATMNKRSVCQDRLHRQFLAAHERVTRLPFRHLAYPRALPMLEEVRGAVISEVRAAGCSAAVPEAPAGKMPALGELS
jgi:hypothetical protein